MAEAPCPTCGRPVDTAAGRCAHDGTQLTSESMLGVASTVRGSTYDIKAAEPSIRPKLEGLRLGKYEIESELGRGGMGTVWRARHTELGNHVAIKVLDPRYTQSQELEARFLREAKAAAKLQHGHVVQVFDYGRDPEVGSYIVMELLRGATLEQVLEREGALPERRALAIAMQIAEAIEAAHALGIVHRDLKPGNVWIATTAGTEVAKVMDFGIAKIAEGVDLSTQPGTLMGTPRYMSPEQWRDEEIDARTDVYALGVVMYRMLTGKFPHTGSSFDKLATAIMNVVPARPAELQPELGAKTDALVMKCLEKSREARFQSMAALLAALHEARDAIAKPERAKPARRSSPLWIVVGAVVALGAISAWLLRQSNSSPPSSASANVVVVTSAPASPGASVAPTATTPPSGSSPPVASSVASSRPSASQPAATARPTGRPAQTSRPHTGEPDLLFNR